MDRRHAIEGRYAQVGDGHTPRGEVDYSRPISPQKVNERREKVTEAREKLARYLAGGGHIGQFIKIKFVANGDVRTAFGHLQNIKEAPEPELGLGMGAVKIQMDDTWIRMRNLVGIWGEHEFRNGRGSGQGSGEVTANEDDVEVVETPVEEYVPVMWHVEDGDYVIATTTKEEYPVLGVYTGIYDAQGNRVAVSISGRRIEESDIDRIVPAPGSVRF